jgi:hypothetical protein
MKQCVFDYSHEASETSIPRGRQYIDRAEMFRVLRYHRGWRVEVFHENRIKWWIQVTGNNIHEIRCDLPDSVIDNHMDALTSIYARIADRAEAIGSCGRA